MCFRKSVLLVALCFVVSGCAAKGAQFSKLSAIPEGKSVVYIYRPWIFDPLGQRYPIVVNNKRVLSGLGNQCYFVFITEPGPCEIHTDTMNIDRVLKFNAESNKSYYIKISMKHYFAAIAYVPNLVNVSRAIKEMKKCKLAL